MNKLNRLVCVAVVGVLMSATIGAGEPAHEDSARSLLASLQAKDKKFDNAIVRYTMREEWVPRDISWKFPPGKAEQHGAPLGRSVVDGILAELVTTLFVVPSLYSLVGRSGFAA
jgi:hypothetical protein